MLSVTGGEAHKSLVGYAHLDTKPIPRPQRSVEWDGVEGPGRVGEGGAHLHRDHLSPDGAASAVDKAGICGGCTGPGGAAHVGAPGALPAVLSGGNRRWLVKGHKHTHLHHVRHTQNNNLVGGAGSRLAGTAAVTGTGTVNGIVVTAARLLPKHQRVAAPVGCAVYTTVQPVVEAVLPHPAPLVRSARGRADTAPTAAVAGAGAVYRKTISAAVRQGGPATLF